MLVVTLSTACRTQKSSDSDPSSSSSTSQTQSHDSAQPRISQNNSSSGTYQQTPPSDATKSNSTAPTTQTPSVVDVGNPTGTGPVKGTFNLYVADAAIADIASHVFVRAVGLEVVEKTTGNIVTLAFTPKDIDLLQYRDGLKYNLFSGTVPIGSYQEVRIVLDMQDPATIASDQIEPLLVPGYLAATRGEMVQNDRRILFGNLEFTVGTTTVTDVTMHVDLRKSIRPISDGLPLDWLIFGPDADYWLENSHPTFLSATVGSLRGLGIETLLAKAVCAYPSNVANPNFPSILGIPVLPPPKNGASECRDASGSSAINANNLGFYIGYLQPGNYVLRLYITDALYIDVPGLYNVTAGVERILDLTWLNMILD